jgi:hypothetical protein
VRRDYRSGEILSGGRYLGLTRSFSVARTAWAAAKTAGDSDEYAASRLLERTSFDLPHRGDIRTLSR